MHDLITLFVGAVFGAWIAVCGYEWQMERAYQRFLKRVNEGEK